MLARWAWDRPGSSTCTLLKINPLFKAEQHSALGIIAMQRECPGFRNPSISLAIILFPVCVWGMWWLFFCGAIAISQLVLFPWGGSTLRAGGCPSGPRVPAAPATSGADVLLRAVYSHNSLFQEMSQEQQNPQTEAKHRALQFRQHNKSVDKVNLKSACFHNGKTNCREFGLQNTVL